MRCSYYIRYKILVSRRFYLVARNFRYTATEDLGHSNKRHHITRSRKALTQLRPKLNLEDTSPLQDYTFAT